jgi:hypothetical protein
VYFSDCTAPVASVKVLPVKVVCPLAGNMSQDVTP